MSSQQTNNNNIDLTGLQPHYRPQASNRLQVQPESILHSNLDIHIPYVTTGITEEQIKFIIDKSGIATVEYCDFVVTKGERGENTSAFVKLVRWHRHCGACEDFGKTQTIFLYLSRETNERWIILPNKNPLQRTHLSVTQLAVSIEDLFSQTGQLRGSFAHHEDAIWEQIFSMKQTIHQQQIKINSYETKIAELENAKIEPPEYSVQMPSDQEQDDDDLDELEALWSAQIQQQESVAPAPPFARGITYYDPFRGLDPNDPERKKYNDF
jgi:hypothetical protein